MNNEPAQSEQEQMTLYLDIKRNWYMHAALHKPHNACKVFFLKDGKIGMEYGGRVVVRSIEHWMSEGKQEQDEPFWSDGVIVPPNIYKAIQSHGGEDTP